MTSAKTQRRRWSISLGAALLVPGGLLLAWALVRGGIEEQQAEERTLAERALAEVQDGIAERLAALQATDPGVFSIARDDGRVGFPFVEAPREAWAPPALGATIETALALLAQGEPERALPFFDNAGGERPQDLPPSAGLAMARCLHACGDGDRALRLLSGLAEARAADWLDGLPVPTLAALLERRIAADLGDLDRERAVERSLLSGALPLPVRGVTLVLSELAGADAREIEDLRRAAAVSLMSVASDRGVPGPDGSVVLPRGSGLLVVAPWRVKELVAAVGDELATGYPLLAFGLDAEAEWLASTRLDTADLPLYAHARGELGSERTAGLARILVLFALGSFVLGNLLLFGLARREVALSRMRSNFIDLVSHELRTPLTALGMKAELLASGEVPDDRVADYQRGLYADAQKLSGLVQRILDFARLQKARLPLEPVRMPARSLVAQGIRAGRETLRMGRQRLAVSAPRQLPEVWVDREVMTGVLRNLIENSCRYAPEESCVEVTASAQGKRLHLTVADRGPGLGEGDLRWLFEPFRRGAREPGGSGLGLSIVKQAVEAHGGTVTAKNREGGGAEFSIHLPLLRRAS